nr:MAG: DNA cytosine methyltransferase [Bacillota bacterium]
MLDLFSTEDYEAFHGRRPPAGWREATPEDLRAAAGGCTPDVVFSSPPCKGFSGLLPSAAAQSARYQALNRLTFRGIWLALEAWREDPPGLIILENVPRITSRGADLLRDLKGLLAAYGYVWHEGYHDCGELGGLGQRRRRYLLVARRPDKVPVFLYRPPKRRVRSIGEILGPLPLPDDPAGGPMHRLPRLQWITWLRLALIPAGGDWRALQEVRPGTYRIVPEGGSRNRYRVERVDSLGPWAADPRLGYQPHKGAFRVGRWDRPATTVVGSVDVRGSNGMAAVADPRIGYSPRDGAMQVGAWDAPAGPVVGSASVTSSNGIAAVADPRLGCSPRNGAYSVTPWDQPAGAVTGAGDVHAQGASCVADLRIPADHERPDPPPVIIAEDGTWHRPLTTWELAALQGFPLWMPDGSPLVLAGRSDRRWREAIGNAVPPPAARAIAESILLTLLAASTGDEWILSPYGTPPWVAPYSTEEEVLAGD